MAAYSLRSVKVSLAAPARPGVIAVNAAHVHSPAGGQGLNTGLQDVTGVIRKVRAYADSAKADAVNHRDDRQAAPGAPASTSLSKVTP